MAEPKKFRFRILQGQHSEDLGYAQKKDDAGNVVMGSDGQPQTTHLGSKTYNAGGIVETNRDLAKIFNQPGCDKFERLTDNVNPAKADVTPEKKEEAPTEDTLSGMTVAELRTFAQEEEIDLGHAERKSDIIDVIRASYK